MAGIYFHIPFCKQACHYCDFHFSTSLKTKDALLEAMHQELSTRSKAFSEPVSTVYFGGGTPSILDKVELGSLISGCREQFDLTSEVEFCLEANPDDLTVEKLADLLSIGIERLSIGLQSFDESQLKDLNRAHTALESVHCIELAQQAGFRNLSIDLIYGLPGLSNEQWRSELQKAIHLGVQHISAYCLTVEEGTALHHFVQKGKVVPATNATEEDHFEIAMDELTKAGFDHYEISNFGKPGHWSKHNTSYWRGEPYLGIGPSAHSFDGKMRRWNVAHNMKYIKAIETGAPYFEQEELTAKDRFNEALMLGLRTSWGVDLAEVERKTGLSIDRRILDQKLKDGYLEMEADTIRTTRKGKFVADRSASDLFTL